MQVGITMVGASSLLGSGDSSSSQAGGSSGVLLGMGLIVFAQARRLAAFQLLLGSFLQDACC